MNHKWNYRPITPEQAETSQTLAQELGISPILGQLLVQRGITKAADAKKFFRPQLPDLHDPFLMKDMDIAVERLNRAMGKKERILIYGDYDVDGTTAVALVYKFIQQFYSNLDSKRLPHHECRHSRLLRYVAQQLIPYHTSSLL